MKGKLFTLLVLLVALCAIAVSEARPSPAQSLRNFNEPPSERASKGGSEVSQSRSSEKSHDGAVFPIPGPDDDDPPEVFSPDWWERLTTVGVLIILGGIFAGLTLGLLSLDETNLKILSSSGKPQQKRWAERIKPIRKNGHLLLVTLLLCNTVINESLPVVLDPLVGTGIPAILSSTALIFVFGEIIPQAVCSRYGLQVGAFFAWPVKVVMFCLLPVTWPISKLLDYILGENHGVYYRRQELKELVTLHGEDTNPGGLTKDEVSIIHGALSLPSRHCIDAYTPLEKIFMLSSDARLDRATMKLILKRGYSRIPVHARDDRDDIIGILMVKQLIMMDPDAAIKIMDVPIYPVPYVFDCSGLVEVLNLFQEGACHMALVYQSSPQDSAAQKGLPADSQIKKRNQLIGIITLEDVIEEVLQEEIIDETDVFISNAASQRVVRNSPLGNGPSVTIITDNDSDAETTYYAPAAAVHHTIIDATGASNPGSEQTTPLLGGSKSTPVRRAKRFKILSLAKGGSATPEEVRRHTSRQSYFSDDELEGGGQAHDGLGAKGNEAARIKRQTPNSPDGAVHPGSTTASATVSSLSTQNRKSYGATDNADADGEDN